MPTTREGHRVWDAELDGPLFDGAEAKPTPTCPSDASGVPRKPGAPLKFRERLETTHFAVSMGFVVPMLCLVFDPIVFRGGDEHGPILGKYCIFAYSFMGLEMATLAVWLAFGERLGRLCGIIAGVLLGGACFASGLGVILLPFSIMGIFFLIGILGFVPWLTAYAYLRQGGLALNSARTRMGARGAIVGLFAGAALAFGLPASAQIGVHRAWREAFAALANGDESVLDRARFWHRFIDTVGDGDPLYRAMADETDPVRKEWLFRVWYR